MKFNSASEMLNVIVNNYQDLYSPSMHKYVFVYTDTGSICVYDIFEDEADVLKAQKELDGEYWGAHLGFGGSIIDSREWYEENNEECDDDYFPEDWCEEMLDVTDWEYV